MSVAVMNSPVMPYLWDDPLAFLPRRKPQRFQKDQTIYTPDDPADSLFLVVDGTVKLSRISDSGRETVLDFCSADSFFGESAIMGRRDRGESAVALDDSSVMEWTRDELGHLMMRTPELGPSMLRVMAAKLYDADSRIESLAIDQIAQRLVKVLLRLGDQFGAPRPGDDSHHAAYPRAACALCGYFSRNHHAAHEPASAQRRARVLPLGDRFQSR